MIYTHFQTGEFAQFSRLVGWSTLTSKKDKILPYLKQLRYKPLSLYVLCCSMTPPCSTLCNPPEPFPFSLLIWMSPIGVLNIVKFLTNDLFCRTRSTCLLEMGPYVCLDPWGDLYRLLPCEHVLRLLSHPMRKHFFCHRTRRWHLYMLGNL